MKPDQAKQKEKRVYEKPRLRTIELAAEEVLAAGCKTESGGVNPVPPSCYLGNCLFNGT
jgi:hypothetical protein